MIFRKGMLEPIPSAIGGHPDMLLVSHKSNTERQTAIQAHIPTFHQFRIAN